MEEPGTPASEAGTTTSWCAVGPKYSPTTTSTLFPHCKTVDDLFSQAFRQFSESRCLGTRELLGVDGKNSREKLVLGEYEWQNYHEVSKRIDNFGRGLLSYGMKSDSKLLIFAETCADWMIAAQACFRYNFQVVTLNATLDTQTVIDIIRDTQVTHILTSADQLMKFYGVLQGTPSVSHLVVMTKPRDESTMLSVFTKPVSVNLFTMGEVEVEGVKSESRNITVTKPRKENIAVIMYTRECTGMFKGVEMTHENMLCGILHWCESIPQLGTKSKDLYIGYVSLAEVLELTAEMACLARGIPIGYSSIHTLTDLSRSLKQGTNGDVTVLKPTLLPVVEAIMKPLGKIVDSKIKSWGCLWTQIFLCASRYKRKQMEKGCNTPLLNWLVFSKLRQVLGGRVRVMFSGGATLSEDIQCFMALHFSVPVLQGYGFTETCGTVSMSRARDLTGELIGSPLPLCEFRLRDLPEGVYTSSGETYPCGEILVGGDSVAQGYFKPDENTPENFITSHDGQRYFCTGDIGQVQPDNTLKIIDSKYRVKMRCGSCVSLIKVETAIKTSLLVDQVCVCARSDENFTVCLVVPNEQELRPLMEKPSGQEGEGTPPADFADLCKKTDTVEAVNKALTIHAKQAQLEHFEIPTKYTLVAEPWTPETGLVNDAFELKRKKIEERFKDEIDAMYS